MDTPSTTDTFLTSAFHAETESTALPNGSNSTTTALYLGTLTPMDRASHHTSLTCMQNPMINMTTKEKQNWHSLSQCGSTTLWWAPPPTSNCYIMRSSSTMTEDLPVRSIATTTLMTNMPTLPSNSNIFKPSLMLSNRLAPVANPISSSHTQLNRLRHSRTYHASPRPCVVCGSVSLVDMVVHSSSGVMLSALRSPAHSDLPCLM